MRCWIVIPVKAPEVCKSRLQRVLTDAERRELVASMLARVVTASRAVSGLEQVALLGPDRHGLSSDIPLLADPGGGLNAALAFAREAALTADIDRITFLSADLPLITREDVAALIDLARDVIAISPDRSGTGTNALSLPLPKGQDFGFHYGENSFFAHSAEAKRLRLPVTVIDRPGLHFDVDQPQDLDAFRNG